MMAGNSSSLVSAPSGGQIDGVTNWQARRGSPDERVENVESLAQTLVMVLETPAGSRPHDLEYGSELWRLVDEPVEIVRALAPGMVVRAAAYEPRIAIDGTVVSAGERLGAFVLDVHWRPVGGGAQQVTRVEVS